MYGNCSRSKGQRSRSQSHDQEIYAVKGFGIGDAREQTTLNRRRSPINVDRQIGVGDFKNVIVFDPLFTGHVIRRMRSGRVRIFNGNQWETLSLIPQERIGVGGSNLVGIIDVGVDACGILSRSVGQTNRK